MPSQCPKRWQFWEANEILVLSNDFFSCSSEEEVDVQVSTSCDVAEDILVISLAYDRSLCIRASKVDTEELVRLA